MDDTLNSAAPGTPQTASKAKWAAIAGFVTPVLIGLAAKYIGADWAQANITPDNVGLLIGGAAGVVTAVTSGYAAWKARNKAAP
ncbi:hypothetical protein SAMN05216548_1326 [Faunimonas pinastri]|uniref:Uncharacterized protein n=1 Tax=Faunimonas pinastri TaxID=1855383 RepID=A0A1H9QRZ8_9HYPH|nr:hypothetical protein [Faunimonas pinastri]SER62629.1 hypothetical protein SAMN05216548_1326 [Faunimonas pinastri]